MKQILIILSLVAIVLGSCSKNNSTTGSNVQLNFAGTTSTLKSAAVSDSAGLILTDFKIVIREIKFDVDGKYFNDFHSKHMHGWMDSAYSNNEVKGPFILNLLENGAVKNLLVNVGQVPNATFDKIEFKVGKSSAVPATDTMNNKSLLLLGTYNGTPFAMWERREMQFKVHFSDTTKLALVGDAVQLKVNFQIQRFLNAISTIDLSKAVDGNHNGILEIGPGDPDGNNALVGHLLENIQESCRLKKD
jgi:hypothetical protein